MARDKTPPPVAEVLTRQSKATFKQVTVRLCDLDLSPSLYCHRDPKIYVYKQDDDNEARKLIESLIVEGQKSPIAYCVINGQKIPLCGRRRAEGCLTAIALQLDPDRFFPEMELAAIEVESPDPNDYLEWSITENEVSLGFTDDEKAGAARKMLDAGFSSSRAAKALKISVTHFLRLKRRLASSTMLDCIKNEALSATDVDNLLEATRDVPKLEANIDRIVAKVQEHIAERRATAVGRQDKFDEEKLGKVARYIKPTQVKQWIKDLKEGRSIDWVAESQESERNFECSFDPEEGTLKIQALNLDVHKLTYEEYGQLAAKLDIASTQVTADFLKAKAVREIRGLATKSEDLGVLDFYRRHKADDLAAELERRVALARGEADPTHGKVEPRQEQSIADAIEVRPPSGSVSEAAASAQPQGYDALPVSTKRRGRSAN